MSKGTDQAVTPAAARRLPALARGAAASVSSVLQRVVGGYDRRADARDLGADGGHQLRMSLPDHPADDGADGGSRRTGSRVDD